MISGEKMLTLSCGEWEDTRLMILTPQNFDEETQKCRPELIRRLEAMGMSWSDAEDIAQDTILKAWTIIAQYDPNKGRVCTWLYVIAVSLYRTNFRKRKRHPIEELDAYPDPVHAAGGGEPDPTADDVADRIMRNLLIGCLFDCMETSLNSKQWAVLKCLFYDNLTLAETATHLQTNISRVRSLCGDPRVKGGKGAISALRNCLRNKLGAELHPHVEQLFGEISAQFARAESENV